MMNAQGIKPMLDSYMEIAKEKGISKEDLDTIIEESLIEAKQGVMMFMEVLDVYFIDKTQLPNDMVSVIDNALNDIRAYGELDINEIYTELLKAEQEHDIKGFSEFMVSNMILLLETVEKIDPKIYDKYMEFLTTNGFI